MGVCQSEKEGERERQRRGKEVEISEETMGERRRENQKRLKKSAVQSSLLPSYNVL